MRNLKRLTALTTLALATLALTAASSSADIVDPVSGDPYWGFVDAVNTGVFDPTFETSSATIRCSIATISGSIDGDAPASGWLDFSWMGCSLVGGATACTVDDINGVSVNIEEWPIAPDFEIKDWSGAQTFISCGLVFNCTVTSGPVIRLVSAEVTGGLDPVASINDFVTVSGTGCPTEGRWVAEYEITYPEDGLESDN